MLLCALVVACLVGAAPSLCNYIATDVLADGELETRVRFNGVTAKETSVGGNTSEAIRLRQATDGAHFLQLIYGGDGALRDCELVKQRALVDGFVRNFDDELRRRNTTLRLLGPGESLPPELAWLDVGRLAAECRDNHRRLRRLVRRAGHGSEEQRRRAGHHLERYKRAITDVFIAPGTKWCGPHQTASTYSELGAWSRTDKCCRRHDHCPAAIPAFSYRHHIFNYRPFTLSHCRCDRSFRSCLKMCNTGAANLVGKLFFNIVQTKCFVLKPKKVCIKKSWWGKCEKYAYKKRAHLRDNLAY